MTPSNELQLQAKINELNNKIKELQRVTATLERENRKRRSEITQLISQINRLK